MLSAEEVRGAVRERYARAATSGSCCGPSDSACCGEASAPDTSVGVGFYSSEELTGLSEEVASFSLGCGNPIAFAQPQPGETVLDLGSGGGLDCFIAARYVGPTGHVIGVDMTPAMLERAADAASRLGLANVEFRQGLIEALPVANDSVDLIISNCVINLSPDKDQVFREAFRVLKPGGRLVVSDLVTAGELPEAVKRDVELWAGCISGALPESDYTAKMTSAGFEHVAPLARSTYTEDAPEWEGIGGPNGPIYSLKVRGYKPLN
ncbi:MAG: arsenite methyltransferase [Anaerolineae bacterium]|nr:arsenite methyltransferase [Anaerolineae bacterium]